MLATLVGLSMLLAVVGGTATLAGVLLARRYREQAAARQRAQHGRRLAAEWPLLAQTLGLGYRDQWTRQHRFPPAEFVADDQGVTATVAAIAGASLADYQKVAGYLADTWGCVAVRAEQQGPGLVRLRGLHRDPLLAPARIELPGTAPAGLASWWLGWAEDSAPVSIRLAEVSGMVVAGLAGFARPCSWPTSWASSPPPQRSSSCWLMARAAPTTTSSSRGPGWPPRTTWRKSETCWGGSTASWSTAKPPSVRSWG
jgi:hypothetical protein